MLTAALAKKIKSRNAIDTMLAHLRRVRNAQDLDYLEEWLENPKIWRHPRVSLDTFLDDPYYLGMIHDTYKHSLVYPEVRKQARAIIDGGYQQAAYIAGIGAGKTTMSEILATYNAHQLLCLRNPHDYHGLASDKPISIINMGTTATQALDNAFAGIKTLMKRSAFFMQYKPKIIQGRIHFEEQDILLLSGNSKATTALGYNVFCAILDEAAFFLDNENRDVAEEIYTALQRRIVSRFQKNGLIIMISSPNYEGDFIMRKLEESRRFPGMIYSAQLPTWKSKPFWKADLAGKFWFNSRKGTILDKAPTSFGSVCKIEDEFDSSAEIWEIPGEYKDSFLQDPEKAKRDLAAVPSKSIDAFIPNIQKIMEMFDEELESPISETGHYDFGEQGPLRTNYYVHIDLALNRNGKGDFAGIAMAHCEGVEEDENTGEKRKKIVVDLAERISAGPTGEIEFEHVRQKVYALKDQGFKIKLVSLDAFQSADTIQIFKSKGIKAEYLSVDRKIDPYQTLKQLIYTGDVKCHKMEILQEELSRLEITKNNKVDHPPGSSKDVADAVCGAVYQAYLNSPKGSLGMAAGKYFKPATGKEKRIQEQKQKEQHYERLQDLAKRGLIK